MNSNSQRHSNEPQFPVLESYCGALKSLDETEAGKTAVASPKDSTDGSVFHGQLEQCRNGDIAIVSKHGRERLKSVRHLAMDMDGTIYSGGTLFPETMPFLSHLKRLNIGHTFLTNNSSKSIADYINHLHKMGIAAESADFFTSTQASIDCLRQHAPKARKLFVLGTESMRKEIEAAGYLVTHDDPREEPDAVLVGFDTELTFSRLCRTAYWIKQEKLYIASHPDRVCPTDQPTVLVDCGSVCAALKEATGRDPDFVPGKPDPRMLQGLLHHHRLQPENLAMVGDRLYTDMEMARCSGALGILVLTGETTLEEARLTTYPPDIIVSNLDVLGRELQAARNTLYSP